MNRAIPLLLLLLAALTVAACGGKTLDTANVEKDIQEIASQDGVETKAECPEEVSDAEKGKTYQCEITYAGNENNKQNVDMRIGDNDESEFVNQKAVEDEGLIRQIVAESDADPAAACQYLGEELLEQVGGEEGCPQQAEEQDDGKPAVIKSISVEGDTATMVTDESTTTFERAEGGGWVATAIQ